MILSSANQRVRRQRMLDAPAITSFDALPLVLTLDDMVRVYRIGNSTLRKQLAASAFRPLPFARDPYRWLKQDVQRDLERRAASPTVRSARGRKKTRIA